MSSRGTAATDDILIHGVCHFEKFVTVVEITRHYYQTHYIYDGVFIVINLFNWSGDVNEMSLIQNSLKLCSHLASTCLLGDWIGSVQH